jgi:hypothetical protein
MPIFQEVFAMVNSSGGNNYAVLSPWAEADPIPSRGIHPRLSDLAGKKIGLLANAKRAARPILGEVERHLKERFPTAEISWYYTLYGVGPAEADTENKTKYEDWLRGVDAVVAAVGD